MKVKVFRKSKQKDCYLQLRENTESVSVIAVDEKGVPYGAGNLLTIGSDGVYLEPSVGDYGIARENTKIKVKN